MHIGIDTVALKGKGFTPRVKVGDKVEAGAPLIEFDLDHVATHAKSLLTQVVIANGEPCTNWRWNRHSCVGKTPVLTFTLNGAAAAADDARQARRSLPSDHSFRIRPACMRVPRPCWAMSRRLSRAK